MLIDMVILGNARSISVPRATTELEIPGFLPTDYDHLRYDAQGSKCRPPCKQKTNR